jgi:hypothetical protein
MDASIRSSYKPGLSVQYNRTKPAAHELLETRWRLPRRTTHLLSHFRVIRSWCHLRKELFYADSCKSCRNWVSGYLTTPCTCLFMNHFAGPMLFVCVLSTYMHSNTAIFTACLDQILMDIFGLRICSRGRKADSS